MEGNSTAYVRGGVNNGFIGQKTIDQNLYPYSCLFHAIRPPIPRRFGHLFHEYTAGSVGAKQRKIFMLRCWPVGYQFFSLIAHGFAAQIDFVCVVHHTVQDGICQRWIAYRLMDKWQLVVPVITVACRL